MRRDNSPDVGSARFLMQRVFQPGAAEERLRLPAWRGGEQRADAPASATKKFSHPEVTDAFTMG
jgi:hypothetical protein